MGIKRILTPLDIHLDTRLGTINRINPRAAEAVISNLDYWSRENDHWDRLSGGLIDNTTFAEAYAARGGENTRETLEGSVRTGITPFILRLLTDTDLLKLNQVGDLLSTVSLVINYWPYSFNSDELEGIRDIMHELYGQETEIEMVWIPIANLTPQSLNENFAACVMYEFHEWIKLHAQALYAIKLNCFNFIAPKLFEQDVSSLPIDQKEASLNAFRLQHLLHMDFQFIDAKWFSIFKAHGK